MSNFFDLLLKWYGKYSAFKFLTVSWFIRIAWAPCILWGLYDFLLYLLGKDTSSDNQANMYIRTGAGFILFLVWFIFIHPKANKKLSSK